VSEQLQPLWLTIADGLWLLRRDGGFLDVNASGCALLGSTRDELLARNVLDVLDANGWDGLWESMRPGGVLEVEAVARRTDGTRVPVQLRITPVSCETGVLMLALVRDVSARRELERLRHLQATARKTAHDLKNLLGVVVSCGEFALEEAPDQPELRADLTEIMRAAERAAALAASLQLDAAELDRLDTSPNGVRDPIPASDDTGSALRETILVVEDEEALRRLTTRILSERGYDILTASSFDDATTVWEAHRPTIDLLVTGSNLGTRSGADLADVVWQTAPELPVLFISADSSDIPLVGGEHPTAVVEQPLGSESLLRSVGAALEGRS